MALRRGPLAVVVVALLADQPRHPGLALDQHFCGSMVSTANDVVKQSMHACQSSLHLDSRCRLSPSTTSMVPADLWVQGTHHCRRRWFMFRLRTVFRHDQRRGCPRRHAGQPAGDLAN
jgi:hypothetical protein